MASSGRASATARGVRSSSISAAASWASAMGSEAVRVRAASHHNGPELGWRATMRRHAVTRPCGSRPNDLSAAAVSDTITACEAPWARAT